MNKAFCDLCTHEIIGRDMVHDRYRPILRDFKLEVLAYYKNSSNAGNLCKTCLMEILTNPDKEEIGIGCVKTIKNYDKKEPHAKSRHA